MGLVSIRDSRSQNVSLSVASPLWFLQHSAGISFFQKLQLECNQQSLTRLVFNVNGRKQVPSRRVSKSDVGKGTVVVCCSRCARVRCFVDQQNSARRSTNSWLPNLDVFENRIMVAWRLKQEFTSKMAGRGYGSEEFTELRELDDLEQQ
jgi:hypothetical protein